MCSRSCVADLADVPRLQRARLQTGRRRFACWPRGWRSARVSRRAGQPERRDRSCTRLGYLVHVHAGFVVASYVYGSSAEAVVYGRRGLCCCRHRVPSAQAAPLLGPEAQPARVSAGRSAKIPSRRCSSSMMIPNDGDGAAEAAVDRTSQCKDSRRFPSLPAVAFAMFVEKRFLPRPGLRSRLPGASAPAGEPGSSLFGVSNNLYASYAE